MTKKATKFNGAVSLEAILASTSGTPDIKEEIKEVKTPEPKEEIKEEPIEEPKEEITEPPVEVNPNPIEVEESNSSSAHKTAVRLIDLGMLEDFEISTSEEDEGTPISEFYSMTEENLKEIVKIHNQTKKSEISSNYISKDGLREHELKVIEILKNGGDLSSIAETDDKAFSIPFPDFDSDDEKNQVDAVYTDLVHGKKLSHEKAIKLIKDSRREGTLKKEAEDIVNNYRKAHSDYIDGILEQQKKDKEFREVNFKENKKALTAKLKEKGLKESGYKKVAAEYAKRDEKGNFLLVNKLKDILDNPEENYELILHLADPKLFKDVFKIEAAQSTQKTIIRLASGASSKGNKRTLKSSTQDNDAPWDRAARAFNESLTKK